MALDEVFMAAC